MSRQAASAALYTILFVALLAMGILEVEGYTAIKCTAAALLAIASIYTVLKARGEGVELGDDGIVLKTLLLSASIPYRDIAKVEMRGSLEKGARIYNASWIRMDAGRFKNREFGTYTLHAYRKTGRFIVVHHAKGVFVYNMATDEDTMLSHMMLKPRARQGARQAQLEAAAATRKAKSARVAEERRIHHDSRRPVARPEPPAQTGAEPPHSRPGRTEPVKTDLFDILFGY